VRVGTRGLLAIAAVGVIVIVGFLWWLNRNPERLFNEGGENFGSSLARGIGKGGNARCVQSPDATWVCEIEQDPGSGYSGPFYRLVETGSWCWRAHRLAPGHRGNVSLTGCLDLHDFILPSTVDAPPEIGDGTD
jgi:hypothetical protein